METEPDFNSLINFKIVHNSQIEMLEKIFKNLKHLYVKDGGDFSLAQMKRPGYYIEYVKSYGLHTHDIDLYPLAIGDEVFLSFHDEKINEHFDTRGYTKNEN